MFFLRMKYKLSHIKSNLLASLYGFCVNIASHLFLIPLFLLFWETEKYSDWIVLTSLTAFFAMTDIGLNTATRNSFVIKYIEGEKKKCVALMTNNYILIFLFFLISIILSFLFLSFFDIVDSLSLHVTERKTAEYVFILLICRVFINKFNTIPDAVYRAHSLTSISIFLNNTTRLIEVGMLVLGLYLGLSLTVITFLYILPGFVLLFYKWINTRRLFSFSFKFRNVDLKLLKSTISPSVGFLTFPLGLSIIDQGFTLVVNKYFGADLLVLYNTTRIMSNFIRSLFNFVQNSVWPEYSIAFGKQDFLRIRSLHRRMFWLSFLGPVLISCFILLFGDSIYTLWTNGKVHFSSSLMFAFLLVLVTQSLWETSGTILMAINMHLKLGILYLIGCVVSLILAILLINTFCYLETAVYCQLIIHLALVIYSIKKALELTQDNVKGLFSGLTLIKQMTFSTFNAKNQTDRPK